MRYIFSSAVIVRPGQYEYRLLTELEVKDWLTHGQFISRVGNRQAVEYIEKRFGVQCYHSRDPISMAAGDEGLVVRLRYQLRKAAPSSDSTPQSLDWEIGLLKRTA